MKCSGQNRTRDWSFIVYPDSAPDNWMDILDDLHIQWINSPLHDRDQNPDRTNKKPHWHVILLFDGVKSFDQVNIISESVNGTIPQKVGSVVGYVRYCAHLDNPEKYQYDPTLIIGHGGVDLDKYLAPRSGDEDRMLEEIYDYIDEHEVIHFSTFLRYCRKERRHDWFPLINRKFAFIVSTYIKGVREEIREYLCEDINQKK